jgi:hypothetical protein
LAYFLITSLASDLDGCFLAAGAPPRWKTEEKRVAKDERYCFPVRLAGGSPANEAAAGSGCRWRSSSVAELGRDEEAAESGSRSAAQSAENEDEVLPLESREELDVEVESEAEAEDVDAEDSSSVRTMEMRGDSCSGRSWPL